MANDWLTTPVEDVQTRKETTISTLWEAVTAETGSNGLAEDWRTGF